MKRSPLKQRTPLQRTSFIRRKMRLVSRPARRIEARRHMRPYLDRVSKLGCAGEMGISISSRGWREHLCSGPIQVMHLGPKPGLGLKCPDDEVGPGCLQLHQDFDTHNGPFRGWTRDERREWADGVIAATRVAARLEE